jgi:FkbM family methyltransferase
MSGVVPDGILRRLPVEDDFTVFVGPGCSFEYSTVANDQIGRALYWRGLSSWWEAETTAAFHLLAREANVVIDIGAHTGVYTLLACAANERARVVSFEPVPRVYQRLVCNVEINGWTGRCDLRREACSDFVGHSELHVPHSDLPSSASLDLSGFRGYQGVVVETSVTTVDEACADLGQIDLVKIDVEGFEERVLYGMRKTLSRDRPKIVVECNADGPFKAVEATVRQFGYRFYHLRPEGPVAVPAIVPDREGTYRNYLCTVTDH